MDQLIRIQKNKVTNDEMYNRLKKIGDLHIYTDGRNVEFKQ